MLAQHQTTPLTTDYYYRLLLQTITTDYTTTTDYDRLLLQTTTTDYDRLLLQTTTTDYYYRLLQQTTPSLTGARGRLVAAEAAPSDPRSAWCL